MKIKSWPTIQDYITKIISLGLHDKIYVNTLNCKGLFAISVKKNLTRGYLNKNKQLWICLTRLTGIAFGNYVNLMMNYTPSNFLAKFFSFDVKNCFLSCTSSEQGT